MSVNAEVAINGDDTCAESQIVRSASEGGYASDEASDHCAEMTTALSEFHKLAASDDDEIAAAVENDGVEFSASEDDNITVDMESDEKIFTSDSYAVGHTFDKPIEEVVKDVEDHARSQGFVITKQKRTSVEFVKRVEVRAGSSHEISHTNLTFKMFT